MGSKLTIAEAQANPTTPGSVRSAFLEAERDKWLTVEEAAYVLRTSANTILQAVHEGHLELFACGKVWRIHVDSLPKAQKPMPDWKKA